MNNEVLKSVSDRICVLYNQAGDIMHIHRVVTIQGARVTKNENIEEAARARAKAAGHDISKLTALEIAGKEYDTSTTYRVDLSNRKLVKAK